MLKNPVQSLATKPTISKITGKIVDEKGLPIVGAVVRLAQGDQFIYSTFTNETGQFKILTVAGAYNITFSATGMDDRTVDVHVGPGLDNELGEVGLQKKFDWVPIVIIAAISILAIGGAFYWIRRRRPR